MITTDVIVFLDPNGTDYVASVDDGETWHRWPAEAHGWRERKRCRAPDTDALEELEPRLAALAIRLSGVEV